MAKHKSMRGQRQVAALCWRRGKSGREVLLITSRETKRWVIPKGWPMEGLKDFNAVKIEAYEEAGVRGRVSRTPLGRFVYDKIKDDGSTEVTVTVYALQVTEAIANWPEKRERKRQWFKASEAANLVDEAGLGKLIVGL